MIQTKFGNILSADVDAIVNTVNCVGIMGKGIALQFKMKYPENYSLYKRACDQGEMVIGKVLIYEQKKSTPKYIINFPTKQHWKNKSLIEDINIGLETLISEINKLNIKSIAIPALGCGLGGLDWKQVKPCIVNAFSSLPEVDVWLYEPGFSPSVENIQVNTKKPKMTFAKALLIKLMQAYQTLGYPHSQLEIQKLMYFANLVFNKELHLNFEKYTYGPYANTINHLLQNMENHYTRGAGDRVKKAEVRLLDNAITEADEFFLGKNEYLANIKRIAQLVDGFETPFGMELLSTVHWVATNECEPRSSSEEIIAKIHLWNDRKKKLFHPHHINIALQHLREEYWISSITPPKG